MFQAINITKLNKQHDIHTRKELFIFFKECFIDLSETKRNRNNVFSKRILYDYCRDYRIHIYIYYLFYQMFFNIVKVTKGVIECCDNKKR